MGIRPSPVLALLLACLPLLLAPSRSAAGTPTFARGGVAVVGPRAVPKPVEERLKLLNLTWYYDYSARLVDEAPGTYKVAVLRGGETNRTPPEQAAAQAKARPGHYWVIFNEPDLEGQDWVSEEFLRQRGQQRFDYYAELYHDYVAALKLADPTARVVAPNLFNWEGGFRKWLDGFRGAYRARYGLEPPVDVWGLHLYSFDPQWTRLPVLDLTYAQRLYRDFCSYLRGIGGEEAKPVWVTELGTIWGYRDISQGQDDLFRGTTYAWPEVTAYLRELIPWLEGEGVDRWFLFGTNPAPDPWAAVPNALYLLDDAGRPTPAGRLLAEGTLSMPSRSGLSLPEEQAAIAKEEPPSPGQPEN